MTQHSEQICDWLDEYLVGELPSARMLIFTEHQDACDACREAVDEWVAMSCMLRTATSALESPSPSLFARIDSDATSLQRCEERKSFGGPIAALVAACLVWAAVFVFDGQPSQQPEPPAEVARTPWSETLAPSPVVELPDDVIGVPIDIDDPDVTVVWIYPIVENKTELN